jgi:hypothetical protein
MSCTDPLRVVCSPGLPDFRLNLHPNDGADLGLMTIRHSVDLDGGSPVEVRLLNECPAGRLEIGTRFWDRIGRPERVMLSLEGETLSFKTV